LRPLSNSISINTLERERERERERELTAFPNPWRNVENSLEVVAVVGASGRVF
jgi:hypothetical protein